MRFVVWLSVVGLCVPASLPAQSPPPLGLPQAPAGNPLTTDKILLGKALFWDEQLSLTGTAACGTCHRPQSAGTDPRSTLAGPAALHPGPDAQFGTADDTVGSPGVPAHDSAGNYQLDPVYGLRPQVGRRKAGSVVNAAFAPFLFWDGRAGNQFRDPLTGEILFGNFAALENQALAPLVNTSEMGHAGVDLSQVSARLTEVQALALASDIPQELDAWIGQLSYPALFKRAFGSSDITPARLAMAIASYQRTLIANQTPIDAERGGTPTLTALELQGEQVFLTSDCEFCHSGGLFSDFRFHYIGVRPVTDDLGRFVETGESGHRGSMLTPGLRGVAERAPYMHNGRLATLEDVVEFYNRGGDFSAPNKAGQVRPRNWTQAQKTALLAFLRRPLSDPRVAAEIPPFDRPTLYTETDYVPQITGVGRPGSGAVTPQITALEPPWRSNTNFTLVVSEALASADAHLVISAEDPGVQDQLPVGSFTHSSASLNPQGIASFQVDLSAKQVVVGQNLWARIYVVDPQAQSGFAVTPAARFTVFGEVVDAIFSAGFE